MTLGEGHRATLEPAVKDLRDSLEHATSFLRGDLDLVDVLSVDISQGSTSRKPLELFNRADAYDFLAIVGDPDGDRVTPEAVSGEAPVPSVLKPVVEAFFLDEARNPAVGLVELYKSLLDISDLDEPAVEATVDQGCL